MKILIIYFIRMLVFFLSKQILFKVLMRCIDSSGVPQRQNIFLSFYVICFPHQHIVILLSFV